MPGPTSRSPISHEAIREIENHYALRAIAGDTARLQATMVATRAEQRGVARDWLAAHAADAAALRTSNQLLRADLGDLGHELADVTDALQTLSGEVARHARATEAHLQAIVGRLDDVRAAHKEVVALLAAPGEAAIAEVLRAVENDIRQGLQASGNDATRWFDGAWEMLGEVLSKPLGRRSALARLHEGWLAWRLRGDLKGAEQAFREVVRLASPQSTALHVLGARHVTHMCLLQARPDEALESTQAALRVGKQVPELELDMARCLARLDRPADALDAVERYVLRRPKEMGSLFTEPDLEPLLPAIRERLAALVQNRQRAAAKQATTLRQLSHLLRGSPAAVTAPKASVRLAALEGSFDSLSLADALVFEREATSAIDETVTTVRRFVDSARKRATDDLAEASEWVANAEASALALIERAQNRTEAAALPVAPQPVGLGSERNPTGCLGVAVQLVGGSVPLFGLLCLMAIANLGCAGLWRPLGFFAVTAGAVLLIAFVIDVGGNQASAERKRAKAMADAEAEFARVAAANGPNVAAARARSAEGMAKATAELERLDQLDSAVSSVLRASD